MEILRDMEDTLSWELEELQGPRQDWKKPGLKKKKKNPSPVSFIFLLGWFFIPTLARRYTGTLKR